MAGPPQQFQGQDFKIVLVGDGGTGKTTYIRKLVTDNFKTHYEPTLAVEINPVDFSTSAGEVRFYCWDTAGQEKFGSLRDSYYDKADAAIIFFDVTSRATFKNVATWVSDIVRICGESIPIVVCANKVDVTNRQVKQNNIKLPKELKDLTHKYVETSVLSNQNLLEPFLFIIKELLGEEATLDMGSSQEPAAPSPHVTPAQPKRAGDRRSLHEKARTTPLPNDA